MTPFRRRLVFRFAALVVSCVVTLLLLELVIPLLIRGNFLALPAPTTTPESVWDPSHPTFGAWHRPGSNEVLQTPLFKVRYRINAVGARDAERRRIRPSSRVIVLGDSVTEGWGVDEPQRLSNLLQSATEKPHANFSMAHFSPYQSYLVYRELASEFAHDMVLLGLFPFNDFTDLDYESAAHAPGYEYRYRPYLIGRGPDYRHFDYRERAWQRFLRRRFYTYGALDILVSRLRGDDVSGYQRKMKDESGLYRSFYYDYTRSQLNLLKHCVELIRGEAEGRPLAVVLFPTPLDLLRSQQSGPSRLAEELLGIADGPGGELRVIDLLPKMKQQNSHPKHLFLSTEHSDFHLSARCNAFAGRILLDELADWYGLRTSSEPTRHAP